MHMFKFLLISLQYQSNEQLFVLAWKYMCTNYVMNCTYG